MTEQAEADNHIQAHVSALAQMAGRRKQAEDAARTTFEAAIRVAFGRMSAECPGLDGTVDSMRIRQGSLAEVLDIAEPGMFLSLLEGQGDRMALVMTCETVLAGIIEAQATGRVRPSLPHRRKPTRTDAALMAPLIESFLRLLEQRCADLPQSRQVKGYVYGSFLDDPRPLDLMLDDGAYMLITLSVSLGLGAKRGDWHLILPEPAVQPVADAPCPVSAIDPAAEWQERLDAVVNVSTVELDAVLARVALSLTEALRLRPGDVLTIPEAALESLSLETITAQPLGIGRLGQARGQRAVRLTADLGEMRDAMGLCATQARHAQRPRQIAAGPAPAPAGDSDAAPTPQDGSGPVLDAAEIPQQLGE